MFKESEFWNDLTSGKFASMIKEAAKGQKIESSYEVYNTMKPLFAQEDDVESLYCIFLNAKHHVVGIEKMFSGSITSAAVYPREILKRVLALKSTCIVLVHNHPSGDTTPSKEDLNITIRIGIALNCIGVTVHDHVIVGDGYCSMESSGYFADMRNRIDNFCSL